MMYCNKCGKSMDQETRFCPECRAQLEQMLVSDKMRKKRKFPILWVALAVSVLLIAGGILTWVFLNQGEKDASSGREKPVETVQWVRTQTLVFNGDGEITGSVRYYFNENGFCVRQVKTDAEENMTEETVFTCDKEGRHIEAVTTYGLENAFYIEEQREKWRYDEYGNEVWYECRKVFDSSFDMVSVMQVAYTYNAEGDRWLQTERWTGSDTEIHPDTEMKLKQLGVAEYYLGGMTAKWYNNEGSLISRIVYAYDKQGNTVKEEHYNTDNQLNYVITYTWSRSGKLVEAVTTDKDGKVTNVVLRTYDDNDNLVRIVDQDGDGNITSETKMTYIKANQIPDENMEK